MHAPTGQCTIFSSWKQIKHCYLQFLFHIDFCVDLAFDHSKHQKPGLVSVKGIQHDLMLKLQIILRYSRLCSI